MNRRKRKDLFRRAAAYLLTLALCFSLFAGTGITSYASENVTGQQLTDESGNLSDEEGTENQNENDDVTEGKGENDNIEETDNETEDGSENETDDGTEDGSEGGSEDGSEDGTEDGSEDETEDGGEDGSEEAGEETDEVTEEGAAGEEDGLLKEEEGIKSAAAEGYIGEVVDGNLEIFTWEMDTFDAAAIEALLQNYEGQTFPIISITVDGEDTEKVINAEIYNQFINYLNRDSEEWGIDYNFNANDDTYNINWCFRQPENISGNIDAGVTLTADGAVKVSVVGAASFANSAQEVNVNIWIHKDWALCSQAEAILGTDNAEFSLWNSSDEEASDAWASWNVEEGSSNLFIGNVYNLTSGEEYVVAPESYKGDTWENDGEQFLGISEWEMGENFTREGVAAMLAAYHAGKTYDAVSIQAEDKEDKAIDAGIYNAVLPYLSDSYEGRRIDYSFNADNSNINWTFDKPTEMTDNISANMTLTAADGQVTVSYQATDAFKACAENVSVNYWMNSAEPDYSRLEAVLGKDEAELRIYTVDSYEEVEGTGAYWGIDESGNGRWLSINGIQELETNKEYSVEKYVYRGNTWEDEGGAQIWLSAFELHENGKFGSGELKSIVDWYVNRGMTFDVIHIEEKYSSSNVIKKDAINQARRILNQDENSEQRLTFVFCRCEGEGEERKENDVRWNVYSPGAASKDINANVTLTLQKNYGAVFKLNAAAAFNAEMASVTFKVDSDSSLGQEIQSVFGEIGQDGIHLDAFKGGTAYDEIVHGGYWADEGEEGSSYLNLDISYVNKCAAKTNYIMVKAEEIETSVNVGEEIKLAEDERFALSAAADGAVTWKAYSSDVIMVASGVMSVIDSGEAYLSASYKSGGQNCFEVFKVFADMRVSSMVFDKTELTMNLWFDGDSQDSYGDCREYLRLKFYPSGTGADTSNPEEVTWASSDSEVVALVADENGNYNGEIQALKPGTATITATFVRDNKEDSNIEPLTATCTITVQAPVTIADEDWPDYDGRLAAVTNFDATLEDIELPENWEWVAPKTSLTPFKALDGHHFTAVYTDPTSKRQETFLLWVRMVTINKVEIVAVEPNDNEGWEITDMPASITSGEAVTLDYVLDIENGSYEDVADIWEAKMISGWSTSPKDIGEAEENSTRYTFSVDHTSDLGKKVGKKTFTLTITNKDTKKAFATASVSVNVTKNPILTEEDVLLENDDKNLIIKIPGVKYDKLSGKKLTVTSEDTAVLKVGSLKTAEPEEIDGTKYTVIQVPYTQKGTGVAYVTVTVQDEAKSKFSYRFEFIDAKPKLLTPTITINKALTDTATPVSLLCENDFAAVVTEDLKLTGDNSDKFTLSYDSNEENGVSYINLDSVRISLKDKTLKKAKSYKLTLQVPVAERENTEKIMVYPLTITVKIAEATPSVSFKQEKKVNTFYTDEEGDALFTVTVKNGELNSLELADCDYELKTGEDGQYYISMKQDTTGADKEGTLNYTFTGYEGSFTKKFTVSKASTKPTIVLSRKSDTLYPLAGYGASCLSLTDKATGEAIEISDARYVQDKKKKIYQTIPTGEDTLEQKVKNNTFRIAHEGENGCISFELASESLGKTDTLAIQVKESNWREYIDISYAIKADKAASPKLKLGSDKLTLNKNDAVYNYQQVKTSLSLKDCSNILNSENTNVWFTGKDTKSKNALRITSSLVLEYWGDRGCVVAKFNNNKLAKGDYKYDVWVECEDYNYKASVPLTIKVVDFSDSSSLSVSAKGSIDVLLRDSTSIAYTPKLKNVTGKVEGGYLAGRDGELFDAEFNEEDGKLYVRAKEGFNYSTKAAYKVKAVFWVQTEDYHGFELQSKELTINVKQGKPKVTAALSTGTLYRQIGNGTEVNISALLNSKEVAIEEVRLLNYTDDLRLDEEWYEAGTDEEGNAYYSAYNPDKKSVFLTTTGYSKEILKSGKQWKVNLGVRYRDKAGNEKDATITVKVTVK